LLSIPARYASFDSIDIAILEIGTSAGTGSMESILPTTSRPTYIDLRRSQSERFTVHYSKDFSKSNFITAKNSGLCALHSYALFENY
jgi:hypothetical protein